MRRTLLILIFACTQAVNGWSQRTSKDASAASCPMVRIEAERLADLNTPREAHTIFVSGGEVVVAGGHTESFLPVRTAERFSGGRWVEIPMAYDHDFGLSLPLSSGKVLLLGGCKEPMGIGQTFGAEMYDPKTHKFTGFGCLDLARTLCSAVELQGGRVAISGNWYGKDSIELFDGHKFFHTVKATSQERAVPTALRTAKDNAIFFSCHTPFGHHHDRIVVDRLNGEPFEPELLQTWWPLNGIMPSRNIDAFIGDTASDRYAYLIPAANYRRNGVEAERHDSIIGQMVLLLVEGETFSLLPTTCPIPMRTDMGGPIIYNESQLLADRDRQRAYMTGFDRDSRLYVLAIDYARRPATLTLYYTEPLPQCGHGAAILTPEGDLLITGGSLIDTLEMDNFKPLASTWRISLGSRLDSGSGVPVWVWSVGALLLAAAAFVIYVLARRRRKSDLDAEKMAREQRTRVLMKRIDELMAGKQLYRKYDLKAGNVAELLGTNTARVMECIRLQRGQNFTQYVNSLRVDYAKKMMLEQPDLKLRTLYTSAGFNSDTSFFRTFKQFTGLTAREWLAREQKSSKPKKGQHSGT